MTMRLSPWAQQGNQRIYPRFSAARRHERGPEGALLRALEPFSPGLPAHMTKSVAKPRAHEHPPSSTRFACGAVVATTSSNLPIWKGRRSPRKRINPSRPREYTPSRPSIHSFSPSIAPEGRGIPILVGRVSHNSRQPWTAPLPAEAPKRRHDRIQLGVVCRRSDTRIPSFS
jgi:hypothetical protein